MKYVRILSTVISVAAIIIALIALYIVYNIPSRSKVITDTVKSSVTPHPGEIWRTHLILKKSVYYDGPEAVIDYDTRVIFVVQGFITYKYVNESDIEWSTTVSDFVENAKCTNCK